MSGSIFATGGFSGLAEIVARSGQVRRQFDALTAQASSGLIAQTYAGLGVTAATALSLNPQINALQTVKNNIDAASGPAKVTQTAMTQIQSIAANLLAKMPNLNGLDPAQIDIVAANARSDLAEVAGLLDSQYGGVYVFAGQDTANPPVPSPDQIGSSGFYTQIAAAVGSLSANGAAATAAASLSIAGSNATGTSPFSGYLSQVSTAISLPSVSTGDGKSQSIGLIASANTGAVSAGASTTGSYMRDLMRALATVGSLSSSQASDPNFSALVADTQTSVTGAISAMATDVGVLGEKQASLTALQTNLLDTATALTGQLSSAQDVDMAATLSSLTAVQTRLQASYQLISASSSMSLVKFLPAGG